MDSWAIDSWTRHLGAQVDVDRMLAELGQGSLPEAFRRTAEARPNQIALRIDEEAITHAQLDAAASRVAGWLQDREVTAGDRVLILGRNSVAFVSAYLGALRTAATVIPASPLLTASELTSLIAQADVKVAFADADNAPALRTVLTRPIVELDRAPGVEGLTLRAVISAGEPAPVIPISSDSPAILAYTSGTTGTPKGVPLTHGNLLASIRSAMWAWRWSPDDMLIHALPLTHQHGLGAVHATLLAGSCAAIHSRFEPTRLLALADEVRATVLFAVPAMYERLIELPRDEVEPFRRLRLAISGSAPLSPTLAGQIADVFGQMPLERYGTTESGLDVSNLYDGPRVVGSVGRPLPGVELRIATDRGAARPDGEAGEILLRGPQVFSGYLDAATATAESFHEEWFRTGDLGRIEPSSGYVEITGRIKELIISGGFNVTPREVELVLENHPKVKEAAVAGLPSKKWGEEVAAWVVATSGEDLNVEEIIAYTRTHLASYKCPKRIFVVEALPRNSLGKVLRRGLRPQ